MKQFLVNKVVMSPTGEEIKDQQGSIRIGSLVLMALMAESKENVSFEDSKNRWDICEKIHKAMIEIEVIEVSQTEFSLIEKCVLSTHGKTPLILFNFQNSFKEE